jgi:hypothetical protein
MELATRRLEERSNDSMLHDRDALRALLARAPIPVLVWLDHDRDKELSDELVTARNVARELLEERSSPDDKIDAGWISYVFVSVDALDLPEASSLDNSTRQEFIAQAERFEELAHNWINTNLFGK